MRNIKVITSAIAIIAASNGAFASPAATQNWVKDKISNTASEYVANAITTYTNGTAYIQIAGGVLVVESSSVYALIAQDCTSEAIQYGITNGTIFAWNGIGYISKNGEAIGTTKTNFVYRGVNSTVNTNSLIDCFNGFFNVKGIKIQPSSAPWIEPIASRSCFFFTAFANNGAGNPWASFYYPNQMQSIMKADAEYYYENPKTGKRTTYSVQAHYEKEVDDDGYYTGAESFNMQVKPDIANEQIYFALRTAMQAKLDSMRMIDRLAQTLYENFITEITTGSTESGSGEYRKLNNTIIYKKYNGIDNQTGAPIFSEKAVTYENSTYYVRKNDDGSCSLEDGKGFDWKSDEWYSAVPQDNISISTKQEEDKKYLQIFGWDEANIASGEKTLAQMLQDGSQHILFYRGTGNPAFPTYIKVGKLNSSQPSIDPDDKSLEVLENLIVGKTNIQIYGYSDTAKVGDILCKGTDNIEWISPDEIEGAIIVGQGSSTAPKYTSTTDTGKYYGTPKTAEAEVLGHTDLGWYELPNVTTNYVQADEATIHINEAIDGETGETCKQVELYSKPEGFNPPPNDGFVYGAFLSQQPGENNPTLKWTPIIGATVAPTIGDNVTISNKLVNAENRVTIVGFDDASEGTFLCKRDGEVRWSNHSVKTSNGIVDYGDATVGIQNFIAAPERDITAVFGDDGYSFLGRKWTKHKDESGAVTGQTYSVVNISANALGLLTDNNSITTNKWKQLQIRGFEEYAGDNGALLIHGSEKVEWLEPSSSEGAILASKGIRNGIGWDYPQGYNLYYGTDASGETGWHSLSQGNVEGKGDISVSTSSNGTMTVYLSDVDPNGENGEFFDGVSDGVLHKGNISLSVTNIVDSIVTREYITNCVNDLYVQKAGDVMTGDLSVEASVDAAMIMADDASFGYTYSDSLDAGWGYLTNLTATTLTSISATIGLLESQYVTLANGGLYATLNLADNGVLNVGSSIKVGGLEATGTVSLNAATTIGGKTPVLVDENAAQGITLKFANGKLVVNVNGTDYSFTPDM